MAAEIAGASVLTGLLGSDIRKISVENISWCTGEIKEKHDKHKKHACGTRWHAFLQLVFSIRWPERMFCPLFPALVIVGQVPPLSTEERVDKKLLFCYNVWS